MAVAYINFAFAVRGDPLLKHCTRRTLVVHSLAEITPVTQEAEPTGAVVIGLIPDEGRDPWVPGLGSGESVASGVREVLAHVRSLGVEGAAAGSGQIGAGALRNRLE